MSKKDNVAYIKSVYVTAEVEKDGSNVDFKVLNAVTLLPIDVEDLYASVEDFVVSNVEDGFHRVLVVAEIGFGADYLPANNGELTLTLSEVESYKKNA